MRMSRRMGLIGGKLPSLQDFWANINVTKISGGSQSTATAYNYLLGSTETPLWTWYSTGANVRIDKVKQNAIVPLYSVGTTPSLNINGESTVEDTRIQEGAVYGAILLCFRCPNYSEAVVDRRLGSIALTVLSSRYNSATGSVSLSSFTPVSGQLYVQNLGWNEDPYGYWSICDGGSPSVAIKRGDSSDTFPYWYASTATKYYLSRNGTQNTTVRCGGIYSISEA